MKIFGIEFFKKSDNSEKIDILTELLLSLSIDEKELLFYRLFDIIKDKDKYNYIKYEINSSGNFFFPNLHPKLNNFFSKFIFFEIGIEESFGHKFVQKIIIDPDSSIEHIQIGELRCMTYYVRYNSLYLYDDDIYDDCIYEEDYNNIDFFNKLNREILFELNKDIDLKHYKKHIEDEYISKIIGNL